MREDLTLAHLKDRSGIGSRLKQFHQSLTKTVIQFALGPNNCCDPFIPNGFGKHTKSAILTKTANYKRKQP